MCRRRRRISVHRCPPNVCAFLPSAIIITQGAHRAILRQVQTGNQFWYFNPCTQGTCHHFERTLVTLTGLQACKSDWWILI